jgi:hypothetical protein
MVTVEFETDRQTQRERGSVFCEVHFGTKEVGFVIEVRAMAEETVEH